MDGLWDGVQQFEDLVRLVTPSSPAPVEQAEPSCHVPDLKDFLGTAESSLEEEIFLTTLDETELMEFLENRGPFASEPNESDLCPSPEKKNVSDCLPTNNQDKAGSSCVPHFIKQSDCFQANDNPLINDSLLNHLGTFNRQGLHTVAAPSTSATDNAASRKRKPDDTEGKAYIKKPLNAFMLFKAEQRQNVADELQITNSAKVNVVLGQRWKMMSEQEQAPYFDQARREKRAHEAKYPGWSYKDSYGKKPKRRKAVKIPVPPNHHHFTFPVAPANQQPVMAWNATSPMSFPNQALNNQAHSYHTSRSQNNQKTIIINGIPVQATPIEACLGDCRVAVPPISREGAVVNVQLNFFTPVPGPLPRLVNNLRRSVVTSPKHAPLVVRGNEAQPFCLLKYGSTIGRGGL